MDWVKHGSCVQTAVLGVTVYYSGGIPEEFPDVCCDIPPRMHVPAKPSGEVEDGPQRSASIGL